MAGNGKGVKNIESLISSLADRFTKDLVGAVREHISAQVGENIERLRAGLLGGVTPKAKPAGARRGCRVPGCTQSAGPRFDYFCAEHRRLPAAKKAEIKQGKGAQPAKAAKTVKAKKAKGKTRAKSVKTAKVAAKTAAPKVVCAVPDCGKGWYRPSGKEKKLCYKHHIEAGGAPSKGWTGPHK